MQTKAIADGDREQHDYGMPLVSLSTGGARVLVISDLHAGAGLQEDGVFDGAENFFAGAALGRFFDWAHRTAGSKRNVLVINGDFLDFLRVADFPASTRDFETWRNSLLSVGIDMPVEVLQESVSKKEIKYGLKTNDFKSIYKLQLIIRGHPELFAALAKWLDHGHQVIVLKGNHDLEWHWPKVRDYLRNGLARMIATVTPGSELGHVLEEKVIPNLIFVDDRLVLDGDIYIEHGHRYDRYSHVLGPAELGQSRELAIPFGSFLNRYLLNRIELSYPFLDNVRPQVDILPLLIREHFFLALKLLFHHIPFVVLIIPKRYVRYLLARVLPIAMALALPVGLSLGVAAYHWRDWLPALRLFSGAGNSGGPGAWAQQLGGQFAMLASSYFLGRLVSYFQLGEPSSLADSARLILQDHPEYELVTFGHTHNPEQFEIGGRWFFNTGTWIPILETSTTEIREDKSYAFLEITRDAASRLNQAFLQRWNDDAGRPERLQLVQRKDS